MKLYLLIALLFSATSYAQTTPSYYEDDFTINIGHPVPQHYDMGYWCDMRSFFLDEIQMRARNLAFRQDYNGAINLILNELRTLQTREFTPYQPLSQNVVKRGIVIGESLFTLAQNDITAMKATTYFLDKYIDYIKQVMNQVDRPYFRGAACGHCGYTDQRAFESDLIDLARQNLELVNDTLVHLRSRVSLGPSKLYFKAVEVLTYYSSLDLSRSLFANLYTCPIREMQYLHHEMRMNRDFSQFQVKRTFDRVEILIEKLLKKRHCY